MNNNYIMKKVYISHPLLGDMDRERPNISIPFNNFNRVNEICCRIAAERPDVLPLSPINAFSFLNPLDREVPMRLALNLLSFADEMWVFGDWETSEGCRKEVALARELYIPIVFEDGSVEGGIE